MGDTMSSATKERSPPSAAADGAVTKKDYRHHHEWTSSGDEDELVPAKSRRISMDQKINGPPTKKQRSSSAATEEETDDDHTTAVEDSTLLMNGPSKANTMTIVSSTTSTGKHLAHLFVERLLSNSGDETKEMIKSLCSMRLREEANHKARADFDHTRLCDYLVFAMKTYRGSLEMMRYCCDLMVDLTYKHNSNKVRLHKAGAPDAVVHVMNKYSTEEDLQLKACIVLRNLSLLPEYHFKRTIVDAGGVEAIVQAMQTHPGSMYIQEHACVCLKSLSRSCCVVEVTDTTTTTTLLPSISTDIDMNPPSEKEFNTSTGTSSKVVDLRKVIMEKGGGIELAACQRRFAGTSNEVETAALRALKTLFG